MLEKMSRRRTSESTWASRICKLFRIWNGNRSRAHWHFRQSIYRRGAMKVQTTKRSRSPWWSRVHKFVRTQYHKCIRRWRTFPPVASSVSRTTFGTSNREYILRASSTSKADFFRKKEKSVMNTCEWNEVEVRLPVKSTKMKRWDQRNLQVWGRLVNPDPLRNTLIVTATLHRGYYSYSSRHRLWG